MSDHVTQKHHPSSGGRVGAFFIYAMGLPQALREPDTFEVP